MNPFFVRLKSGLLLASLLIVPAAAFALPPLPALQVPAGISGESAITALGTNLAGVAAHYGRTAATLSATLRNDSSLHLDATGNLYFACPGAAATTGHTNSTISPLFPLSQTFLLHSKAGSTKTIYLDFDGYTISGTAWNAAYNGGNDIVAPPWDIDGNPFIFGVAEQTAIQQAWLRVAEDYAPFDVDVTTEFPGEAAITRSSPADQVYGTRALISPIASQIVPAGGVAYLGAFNEVGDFHKPALIFPENLLNDEKDIAEATSHEVGHNLNLLHQGTTTGLAYFLGQGNWAPIMGAGYYVPIVQWAKGEYPNANNQEDELALITSTGLNYRTNDFGASIQTATALAGVNPHTNGIIAHTGEADYFSFQSGAGPVEITVTNWERGASLHHLLTLYNSGGTVITNIESADTFAGGINNTLLKMSLADGKYYISITGKASGSSLSNGYSSYGSLGHYTLSITNNIGSGTVISAPPPPYGTTLAALNGGNPNGAWSLFVQDDSPLDAGVISNGWMLTLTTANPVGQTADVGVTVTASPASVLVNGNVAFLVGVTNYGPSTASNVFVIDNLPLNATYLSNSLTLGSLLQSGNVLSWTVGTLATNAGASLTLYVQAGIAGTIVNSALASSDTPDANPDDNLASVSVAVGPVTPPQISAAITIGNTFQFSITSLPGQTNVIQATTNLANPAAWVPIYTNVGSFIFIDNKATNYPYRFYRDLLIGP